ncbi:MAG: transposase, partial [Acidobacteriota bacterium]
MPQSLAQIYLHVVFSTKERFPFLVDPVLRSEVHRYLATASRNQGCPCLRVGGIEDHVHLALRLGRERTIAALVRDVKRESSKWLQEQGLERFRWQAGYGAFSVSPGHLPAVMEYIDRQEEHHRGETFQQELR